MTDETTGETPADGALPAETQVPDSPPAAETTTPDDAGQEQARDEHGRFQSRIDRVTWEKHEALRRAEAAERERDFYRSQAEYREPPKPAEPQAPPTPAKRPRLEDFGYDEAKHGEALEAYLTAQAEAAADKRWQQYLEQQRAERRQSTFAERQAAFAKDKPDYQQKVAKDPTLPISPAMRDVIVDSPNGPEVAYWLAEHREDAARIAQLPAHLAAAELGRIEGRIEAQREAVKAKPAPAVTQAPPPPPQVDAAEPEVDKDPDEMSVTEWKKWREKGMRKKKV